MSGAHRWRGVAALRVLPLLLSLGLACCDAPARRGATAPAATEPGGRAARLEQVLAEPIRLVLLGDLHGVLEPCGCSRESLGGADRLAHELTRLRRSDDSIKVIASGDLLFPAAAGSVRPGPPSPQAVLEAEAWIALFQRLQFAAIVPGSADVAHAGDALRSLADNPGTAVVGPLLRGFPPALSLSEHARLEVRSKHVELLAGARARGSHADLEVRFLHSDTVDARDLVGIDLLVQSGTHPSHSVVSIEHGTLKVAPAEGGRELVVLELWPRGGTGAPWEWVAEAGGLPARNSARVEVLRLDANVPVDPEVRRLLDQVFRRVGRLNQALADAEETEGVAVQPGPPGYVGSRTCAACHTGAYVWWLSTPHARAYQTLLARERGLDLDCIGCHVTGFGAPGGARLGKLEELQGVGCESCHGPGADHVQNPRPPHRSVRRAVPETRCAACHDRAHSDDFDYARQSARLRAPGHADKGAPRDATPD